MNEKAERGRRCSTLERRSSEGDGRDPLKQTRNRRAVRGDAQDAREKSIDHASQKSGANE
jgi:hypothetical protein